MGQLALGIAGGIIGGFFGMPQLGFLAGSLIGGFLFPAKGANQQGPRLDNLAVTSSAYGSPIYIIYGTVRTGGQVIWNGFDPALKETAHKQKTGGKGGMGGGGSYTSYTYNWTGAVGICEGPITAITRIWADTKLVYDGTSNSVTTKKDTMKFRVYYGTEDQLPDPAFEARFGADNVNANRGMAYVVFDNIPVTDYGNRVPQWSFEVVVDPNSASNSVQAVTDLVSGPVATAIHNLILPDWTNQRFYTFRSDGIRAYSIPQHKEVLAATKDDILDPNSSGGFVASNRGMVAVDDDGFIYAQIDLSNSCPIVKINGFTLREVARIGPDNSNLDPRLGIIASSNMYTVNAYSATSHERYLVNCTLGSYVQFIHCDTMGGAPAVTGLVGFMQVDEQYGIGCPGPVGDGNAVTYIVGSPNLGALNNDSFGIYKVIINANAHLTVVPTSIENANISHTKIGEIAPSEIVDWWTYFEDIEGVFYSQNMDRLYMVIAGGRFFTDKDHRLVCYNPNTDTVEWSTSITINVPWSNLGNFTRGGGEYVSYASFDGGTTGSVQTFSLADGTLVSTTTGIDFTPTGTQVMDTQTGMIIVDGTTLSASGETHVILFTGRGQASYTTDGVIVADLCRRIGLEPGDIDVTELNDIVRGYVISSQMTVRAGIEPLALAFFFDGVESDYKLKFLKRGRTPSFALTGDDLQFVDEKNGIVLKETRTQEVELPERVSLVFLDKDKDYEPNTMTSKRVSNPTPTMFSRNQVSHTVPMVMSVDDGKGLAEKLLFTSWIERVQADFNVSWTYLKLDPVDSGTVTLADSTVYSVRLVGIDTGVDWSMQMKAVSEDATSYTSDVVADGGQGFPQQLPPGPTQTKTFLLDTPLLQDVDDTGGVVSRLYTAAGGFGSTRWPGERLLKSADGSFYDPVATIKTQATWGYIVNTLGSVDNPFKTDEVNTITLMVMAGDDQLESITQLEMVNGANGAVVLNESTGVPEIIQFRDVTQNADGSFTLSGLLRGRRGTDVYVGTHVAGETFVLLQTEPLETFTVALGDLNLPRYYKGVPYGTFFEDANLLTLTATGRDLKPYAPWCDKAQLSGSDISITWNRRTRVGGELHDGTGTVPLAETTEAYEIDIYNGSAIVRTLTSVTNSKTYLAADITTDFGGAITTLKLAIYQMSEAVGRGFAHIKTIDVLP